MSQSPPFTDTAHLQAMLDVEVALAVAQAEVGVIPEACVADIRAAARIEQYDIAALQSEGERAGNIAIPLVRRLTEQVGSRNPESARYVHRGATSQDVIDTAQVLQLRAAAPALQDSLSRAMTAAGVAARTHATTVMAGRTWLQQATPTTFGLKAAGWLDLLGRCRERLSDRIDQALVLQFGGASGTLAALGADGPRVAEALGRHLSLAVPDVPWHTHRDRLADAAAAMGITCGALGKIGRDLTLLAQSEVGEVFETPASGRGGSSSMPHKQNPVRAVTAVAASIRAPGLVATMLAAMPQEHERAAGGWQAEWSTLPQLLQLTMSAAECIAAALSDLTVDSVRMRSNLDLKEGVAMAEALAVAVALHVPRAEAMSLVERLSRAAEREQRPLRDVAAGDAEILRWLSRDEIARVMTPENYLGAAVTFVERVLKRWSV